MTEGNLQRYLLPNGFQKIGFVLTLAGLAVVYARFGMGYKPDFLNIQVFAAYSSIFESKYFSIVGNNISEEIGMLLLLAGLFFTAFAREKIENEHVWSLRLFSFVLSFYTNSVILFAAMLFFYGWGFLAVMAMNLFSVLVFYNLIFRYLMFSEKKKIK
jgi:putative effector of murein hydrolase LrgA (UPF0299 family)